MELTTLDDFPRRPKRGPPSRWVADRRIAGPPDRRTAGSPDRRIAAMQKARRGFTPACRAAGGLEV